MKSPEFIPRDEEGEGLDKTIYRNDPNRGNYIPIDEAPDPDSIDFEDKLIKKIDDNEEENQEESEELKDEDFFIPTEDIDVDELTSNEKEIGFLQGEGVAHIGPDVSNAEIQKTEKEEPIPEEVVVEYQNSPQRKNISTDDEKLGKGKGHDNLKTEPFSERQRRNRGKISEILKNPDNWSAN